MTRVSYMNAPFDIAIGSANSENSKFSFAFHRYNSKPELKGLVVSSDEDVRRKLTEIIRQHGLTPILAWTVAESRMRVSGSKVQIVVCQDWLVDGKYDAILKITNQIDARVPVIVFSRTGNWPEYLTALRAGVFDYLAYPPIPWEPERTIQNALRECRSRYQFNGNGTWE